MKAIRGKLKKCEDLRIKLDAAYDKVLEDLLEHFDFSIDSRFDTLLDFFHVEYQPSDGIVLGDNNSYVYSIGSIINHIRDNGKITSLQQLRKFTI